VRERERERGVTCWSRLVAGESIARVAASTPTVEAANSVDAPWLAAAAAVHQSTLVDVCPPINRPITVTWSRHVNKWISAVA